MLQISRDQEAALRAAALERYADGLVEHCRAFSPRLAAVIGDVGLRIVVRRAIERARAHGFTFKGPTRLIAEATLLFGSDFDADPQYPRFAAALSGQRDQMCRAERLFEQICDYVDAVAGPNAENETRALHWLAFSSARPLDLGSRDPKPALMALLTEAFPEKVNYLGAAPVAALVDVATIASTRAGLPGSRGPALVSALMFAFGSGCLGDPLYPWIGATWRDERIRDGEARMVRLENKARTWLDHVLGEASV